MTSIARPATILSLSSILFLWGSSTVLAATTVTAVNGRLGPTQDTCLQGLTTSVGDGENCMYDGGPSSVASATPFGEVTGPYNHIAYYDSLATPASFVATTNPDTSRSLYAPTVGDGKIEQVINGSFTIDDNGSLLTGTDDKISFTMTLTSPGAGAIVRSYGSSVIDKYNSMTQTLAPYTVNFATANAFGGFDYIIGSEGFPSPLTYSQAGACAGALLGYVECGHSFGTPTVEPDFWNGTSTAGIGSLESNFGAKTVGTVTGLACIDSRSTTTESNDCRDSQVSYAPYLGINGACAVSGGCVVAGVRGASENVGWDHLLLKVSTDSVGTVVSVAGYNVDDYRVFGTTRCGDADSNGTGTGSFSATCNSWTSGYFTLDRVPPVANDDGPFDADEGVARPISVMLNDTAFANPVTVTVTTNPTKGTAIVSGSPGPQSGILITYTANIGAFGGDTFVYTVLDADGTTSDTATVTMAVGIGAKDDTATTTRNQAVNINVGTNDTGFDNSVTVTINPGSFSAGGFAVVASGNGGPASGIVVAYTPSSAANANSGYNETFTYTIDDGVLPADTATVNVRVNNQQPNAIAGNIDVSTLGFDPAGRSGLFTVQNTNLGNTPTSTVSVTTQGARGTAAAAGTTITYTISDTALYAGSDSFTYTITDNDGETSTGTLTVLVADALPGITQSFIVTGEGKASVPLKPDVVLGNGAVGSHTLAVSGQGVNGSCTVSPADGAGKIVYTPADPAFVGTDSCQVTLADGDGDTVVGGVSITVTERPRVGGASALDPWALLLLAGAPLLRRRRQAMQTGQATIAGSCALLAGIVLGTNSVAFSQEADNAAPKKAANVAAIQEIVVTARKVSENLQEVPLAITAFDADIIESKGITSLTDVAALTPGLSFFNAFGENLPVPVIRGIAPTDIFGQNNAAVFVDGVYISGREGLNFSQLDIARIEVVKGPQSALYGRNAFSGAINYVTKPPSEEFEAKSGVEVGNRGKIKGQTSVSGPILGDSLRGRIAGLYEDWDGSYDNAIEPQNDIGGNTLRSFQGALLWLPADAWQVNLSYYKSSDDIDEAATVSVPLNCEDRVNDNNSTQRLQNYCGEIPDIEDVPGQNGSDAIAKVAQATGENRELDRANLKIDWDLYEHGSLSALTGYSNTQQDSVSDFSRSLGYNQTFLYCANADYTPGTPNSCGANPANQRFFTGIYNRELGAEVEEWSQELRYTSPQNKSLRYTAGGYWYTVNQESYPGGTFATGPLPDNGFVGLAPFDELALAIGTAIFYDTFAPDGDGGLDPLGRSLQDRDTEGWALFTGADYDLTDRLIGRAEIRLSQESQSLDVLRYLKCDNGAGGSCVYSDTEILQTLDDRFDLRVLAPQPLFGPDCLSTDAAGNIRISSETGDPIPARPGQCSATGTARFTSVTGRIGLDFKISDLWMVYGSIAYGEKPGGLQIISSNEVVPGGGTQPVVINSTFEPEEITAYELGLKGAALDGRLTISSAVFYNDWKKIVLRQLSETNPDTGATLEQPAAINVNAADSGVWGFELEANAGFTENLKGRFTLGWVDAPIENAAQDTYKDFPSFAPDGDVSGNQLLRQPEWLLSTSLDYEHQLLDDWDWYVGADANYQSGVYVGNDNQAWLPEHTYVNTRLGVRSGQYTVEFWTRNLFNDNSAVAAFRDIYWANTDNQYEPVVDQGARPNFDDFVPLRMTVTYPRERTYGVTATMRFGAAIR